MTESPTMPTALGKGRWCAEGMGLQAGYVEGENGGTEGARVAHGECKQGALRVKMRCIEGSHEGTWEVQMQAQGAEHSGGTESENGVHGRCK